jgi:glycosyltransferase involved in cell wall biosynthesis
MNILVINWQDRLNPFAGGAEVHLHEIFSRIASWGHSVTLLASGFPGAEQEATIDGIHVIRKGMRNTFNFFVPVALKEITQRKRIDVLVEDLNKIPFFTPLYMNIPTVAILLHRFGRSIFKETLFPFAMYVYIAESLVPIIYRDIPFDVISESTEKDLVLSGIRKERIFVHHCGIDTERYRKGRREKIPFLVTFMGRIKRYKSIEHLLYAVPALLPDFPQLKVMVVGDGDDLSHLKRLASSLGIHDRIGFTGFVSEADKVRILQESEIVVNTSSKEGWGLTVIESNACGTPVVAADSPGLRDSVRDGFNGILYPYGDVESLSSTIKRLFKDRELLSKLTKNAYEWSRRFNWDQSARGILELLEKRVAGEI